MKRGLVLEGGAMRGMFTAGVLDIFMENNIFPDGTVGVSAGAAFGCNLKSRQRGRTIRYNVRFARDPRYASWRSLFLTGDMYNRSFCYDIIPNKLDPFDASTFAADPMAFYVVATDVETGKARYHLCHNGLKNDLLWIQASASMPLVSKPVEADGYRLLDGSIGDSIPLRFMEEKGYERTVVILTRPRRYRKEPFSGRTLAGLRIALHAMPAVYEALKTRAARYNAELEYVERQEATGRILIVRPQENLQIGSLEHDPREKIRVYQAGRRAGLLQLEKIRSFYEL